MSHLEDLIAEYCPDGVTQKELGCIVNILDSQRKPVTKSDRVNGIYPYYGANGIQDYVDNYIFDGTFLLMGEDGSVIKENNSPVITWAVGKIWVNNHAHVLSQKEGVSLRYLYYYLQTIDVSSIVRGVPPKINQKNLREIIVPIPPLPIQEEIVRILDKMTFLEAELEAELKARILQYEHYRANLLDFNPDNPDPTRTPHLTHLLQTLCPDGVKLTSLGKIANYSRSRIKASEVDSQNYVGVDNLLQNKLGKTDSDYVPNTGSLIGFNTDDILIGNIRPYLKKIWLSDIVGGTNGDVLVIQISEEAREYVSPKYLFFILSSESFFEYNVRYSKGAKMPRGDKQAIMKYEFNLPPLPIQEEIVAILDRFEALVSDLKDGLPAEITARRKQYEHYRNQLLTFKPKPPL